MHKEGLEAMTQIDYEAEVKKVYPDAHPSKQEIVTADRGGGDYDTGECDVILASGEQHNFGNTWIIGSGDTAPAAWKSAYERMKGNEG